MENMAVDSAAERYRRLALETAVRGEGSTLPAATRLIKSWLVPSETTNYTMRDRRYGLYESYEPIGKLTIAQCCNNQRHARMTIPRLRSASLYEQLVVGIPFSLHRFNNPNIALHSLVTEHYPIYEIHYTIQYNTLSEQYNTLSSRVS
jgi:hypothetical protein